MDKLRYFGHLEDNIGDPFDYYINQNYIVCRGATDQAKIDKVLQLYRDLVINSESMYLRQSGQWEQHVKTDVGGVVNCFLNCHSFEAGANGRFSRAILSLLSSPLIKQALSQISGKKSCFKLFQTMLFDHSVTRSHQDWIYLDSRPNGHLIAAWVALEDTHPEGIRFYVYPGSHNFSPHKNYLNTTDHTMYDGFLVEVDRYLESSGLQVYAPPLNRGDIFFWSSRIIHGSAPGSNSSLRRRSIAAHFVPDGFGFGNLREDFSLNFKTKYDLIYADYSMDNRFQEYNKDLAWKRFPKQNPGLVLRSLLKHLGS
ncbi:phytanoyl-CoA dioxygenase family protein [Synechococcus sp. EJ6-Ellesmere]|uniref:phytanoyl-CoA dioxygenase family protein n=1 Tax=Synechococcus sp. EJ6-Ellesmere TaxID=2823734 RepID=UPI0020CFBC3D|nr:phytanoyl-CoA dioxygenase family protein [Synechococcus sp. EJ6-Ellesmere]